MQFPEIRKTISWEKSKFYKRLILTQYILIIKRVLMSYPPIEQIGGANGLFLGHYNE